jgi:hypothetical protein
VAKREEKTGAWLFRLRKTTKFEGMKQLNLIPISSIKKLFIQMKGLKVPVQKYCIRVSDLSYTCSKRINSKGLHGLED